jgi:hypothetical protein
MTHLMWNILYNKVVVIRFKLLLLRLFGENVENREGCRSG